MMDSISSPINPAFLKLFLVFIPMSGIVDLATHLLQWSIKSYPPFLFPVEKNITHNVCIECQMAKSHYLPFKSSTFVSSKPLDLIFTDV